ncbi:hypothetical protein JAB1_51710 [Janthinobacterium sp. MP5059B]|nr:hypothetical protein JAB1_51710 [Janthinobacterium sp. MP5059B]
MTQRIRRAVIGSTPSACSGMRSLLKRAPHSMTSRCTLCASGMVRRSFALSNIRRAQARRARPPSNHCTPYPGGKLAASAAFSLARKLRVLSRRRCTLRCGKQAASGSGCMPGLSTRRTSKVGSVSGMDRRRRASMRKPWLLAASAMLSSKAPSDSWLGWPSRSYTQWLRVSKPCTTTCRGSTTSKRHGCVLSPLGAQRAWSRMFSSTGSICGACAIYAPCAARRRLMMAIVRRCSG